MEQLLWPLSSHFRVAFCQYHPASTDLCQIIKTVPHAAAHVRQTALQLSSGVNKTAKYRDPIHLSAGPYQESDQWSITDRPILESSIASVGSRPQIPGNFPREKPR